MESVKFATRLMRSRNAALQILKCCHFMHAFQMLNKTVFLPRTLAVALYCLLTLQKRHLRFRAFVMLLTLVRHALADIATVLRFNAYQLKQFRRPVPISVKGDVVVWRKVFVFAFIQKKTFWAALNLPTQKF